MYFTRWAASLCKNAFLHFCVAAFEKQRSLSITISTEIGD